MRPAELAVLLERFGNAAAICSARARDLRSAGLSEASAKTLLDDSHDDFDALDRWLENDRCHLLAWSDERYPLLLRDLRDAPLALYVHGDPDCLSLPLLAIVGSRNPTSGGAATGRAFAADLARAGLGIVSGLAQGIDTAAHGGTLDAGGTTIAVLGTGIDRVYPAANRELAHRIASTGALISEYPLSTPPIAHNFPLRNRIISGLSVGTLVVEAAQRSGSLITARLAADQGREVFAIPGSIHNPMARGCHRLIRDGARLVESTDDIFSELTALAGVLRMQATDEQEKTSPPPEKAAERDGDYIRVLDALGWEPVSLDLLAERSGLTIAELSSMLLILELEGSVESLPGSRYSRLKQEHQSS